MKLSVPFYKQTTELNCGPIALKMALKFLGEEHSMQELEKVTEIKNEKGLSTLMLAIAAKRLGFPVKFYSKVLGINKGNLKMPFYKKYGNLEEEASDVKFKEAEKLGVELHEKILTLEQILENIQQDRIMIILLDWNIVKSKKGYQGHFVPITGYDEQNIYIHNHGLDSSQEFMPIPREIFDKARKAKGTDQDLIIVYKK